MKDFIKETKYEQDFPEEGDWNWKTVTLNTPNDPYYHNHKITGVLLHDGSFVVNGIYYDKEEVGKVEDDPFLNRDEKEKIDTDLISDGYHTFGELYEFRKVYNAILFNEWFAHNKYSVHKSIRHSDGELCFGGGWFIVVAQLPTGQISNHYEMKDWDLFKCPEETTALFEFDGHTPQDVLERLRQLTVEDNCN